MGLLLGQSERITSWLTPVWMLSTGLAIGFIVVLILWVILLTLGKVPALNRLNEKPATRLIGGLVLSAAVFAVLYLFAQARGYWNPQILSGDLGPYLFLMVVSYVGFSLFAGFGLLAAISRSSQDELRQAPRAGMLYWTSLLCIGAAVFSLVGYGLAKANGFGFLIPVDNPDGLVKSAVDLPGTGESSLTFTVPETSDPQGIPIAVDLDGAKLRWVQVKSTQPIEIAAEPITDNLSGRAILEFGQSDEFSIYLLSNQDSRFPAEPISNIYVANRGNTQAMVTILWLTTPEFTQSSLFWWAGGSVVFLYLVYFLFSSLFPKVYAIALSTFKTEVSQPVFMILLLIGLVFVVASIYIPYNTFGEDIKMYKDSGLTLLRVLGIFLAVWAASKSLAEEIEGRTALTVLSKPVSRRQFILGKYSGIGMTIAVLFIILGVWFVIWVAYKPIYDSQESSIRDFSWQNCHREAVNTIPGLVLAWLEAMVFAAISVAISTRLGILANFLICFAIYVLGHLTPLIVQSAEVAQSFEGVVVFGQLISILFPVLDHFDINAAITGDEDVPVSYLGWSAIYSALYGLIALLLALVLFEDRDLA